MTWTERFADDRLTKVSLQDVNVRTAENIAQDNKMDLTMLVKLKSTRSRPYPVTVARLKGITYLRHRRKYCNRAQSPLAPPFGSSCSAPNTLQHIVDFNGLVAKNPRTSTLLSFLCSLEVDGLNPRWNFFGALGMHETS